jgi:uncharacterized protein YdaU (DUF1376 family)
VHYYQFNIDEFTAITAHLSPVEGFVYIALANMYYREESPIPLDTSRIFRKLKLVPGQENILKDVLIEMFYETESGWRNERIDADIAKFQANHVRNQENGKKGGRPKTSQINDLKPNETQPLPNPNPTLTKGKGNKELRTINKELKINTNTTTKTAPPAAQRVPRFSATEYLTERGVSAGVIADWLTLRDKKRSPATETAIKRIMTEANKAGITLECALETCCVSGWSGFKADWVKDNAPAAGNKNGNLSYGDGIAAAARTFTKHLEDQNEHIIIDINDDPNAYSLGFKNF